MRRTFRQLLPLAAICGIAWGSAFGAGILYARAAGSASPLPGAVASTGSPGGGAPAGGGNIQIIQVGP